MRSNFIYIFLCTLLVVFVAAAPAEQHLDLESREQPVDGRDTHDLNRRDEAAEGTEAGESVETAEAASRDRTGRCPKGKVPRTLGTKILLDGCSVPKGLSFAKVKRFTSCCNKHDTCYAACGRSKPFCDNQFHNCMLGTCGRFNLLCRAAANIYFDALRFPEAQRSFDRATKRYCRCH